MSKEIVFLKSFSIFRSSLLKDCKLIYDLPFHFERPFERFDFGDEWNNLGYGRIRTDGSQFAIANYFLDESSFDKVVARFHLSDGTSGVYAGIKGNILTFNREIGPVDGIDACLIEDFLNDSQPVLIDIPYGFNAAVTMRIDCDEAISSGKILVELYKEMSIPFSMAIKTSLGFDSDSLKLMYDLLDEGGSILSHSETHTQNWGGSRENAKWEAETARAKLKEVLPSGYNFDFVVSPFHQNPQYAVEGLRDAGIKGFVAGIIKNDPEYLVSRASWAKNVPGIMTHSQQCMLHGDSYHNAGNTIDIYKESFENHYRSNTFFGFLDHPFSSYQYGWLNEEERLNAHKEFLLHIKKFDGIWFANLVDAMSFLWVKVNTRVWIEDGQLNWEVPPHDYKGLPDLCVLWKGEKYRVPING